MHQITCLRVFKPENWALASLLGGFVRKYVKEHFCRLEALQQVRLKKTIVSINARNF
jgi:hypothetical protein